MKEKANKNIFQKRINPSFGNLQLCPCGVENCKKKVQTILNFSRSFKFSNDGKSNDGDITEELTTKAGSAFIIYNSMK